MHVLDYVCYTVLRQLVVSSSQRKYLDETLIMS